MIQFPSRLPHRHPLDNIFNVFCLKLVNLLQLRHIWPFFCVPTLVESLLTGRESLSDLIVNADDSASWATTLSPQARVYQS